MLSERKKKGSTVTSLIGSAAPRLIPKQLDRDPDPPSSPLNASLALSQQGICEKAKK